MSRIIKFVCDLGEFRSGNVCPVEDQLACDAIAQGFAVPTIDPVNVESLPDEPETALPSA